MRKLYVWPKRGFLAVAYAETLDSARQLLLEEIASDGSDGSLPAVTRAVEAVKAHNPQIFAYQGTAEFVVTESGQLEACEKAEKELLHAAENLYAFTEVFDDRLLTAEGKRQVSQAYATLKANGSKMRAPSWERDKGDALCERGHHFLDSNRCTVCHKSPEEIADEEELCRDEGRPQQGAKHVCVPSMCVDATCEYVGLPHLHGTEDQLKPVREHLDQVKRAYETNLATMRANHAIELRAAVRATISDLRMYMAAATVKNPLLMIDDFEEKYTNAGR